MSRTPAPTSSAHPHKARHPIWSLTREQTWNLPYSLALFLTIPAFYLSLDPHQSHWPAVLYACACVVSVTRLAALIAPRTQAWRTSARDYFWDLWLVAALIGCLLLPASSQSEPALAWRMASAFIILLRLVQLFRHTLTEGGLVRLLALATAVLVLCGAGFYWLDPGVQSLEDGIWLAFITAATVGYGDVVPSTTASRIFSVFVVLLGCGVLSLVTASIAAMFVKSQEQHFEREILHELHRELKLLRAEVAALRQEVRSDRDGTSQAGPSMPAPAPPQRSSDELSRPDASAAKASSPSNIKVSTIS